jgi:hypothetical protein
MGVAMGLNLILRLVCALVGFAVGVPFGEGVYVVADRLGMGFTSIYIAAFVIVGGLLAWYVVPLENRYIWSRLGGRRLDAESVEAIKASFRPAPTTLFFVAGMLVGLSHRRDAVALHWISSIFQ